MAIFIPSTLQLQAPWKREARGREFFQLLLTLSEHPFFQWAAEPSSPVYLLGPLWSNKKGWLGIPGVRWAGPSDHL